jgi:hypothetical protein
LTSHREDASAYSLFVALTQETLKRADSPAAAQREFDAQDLAAAAGRPEANDFDASKRWVVGRGLETYAAARRKSIENHFRAAGHDTCLRPTRRSPGGKHRAVWYLEQYPLPDDSVEAIAVDPPPSGHDGPQATTVQYEFTPPGQVKAAWYSRPLIGAGSFVTRSWRGILWAAAFLVPVREFPTDTGPADYVLFVDREAAGVIEAKRDEAGENITATEDQTLRYANATLKWRVKTTPLPLANRPKRKLERSFKGLPTT